MFNWSFGVVKREMLALSGQKNSQLVICSVPSYYFVFCEQGFSGLSCLRTAASYVRQCYECESELDGYLLVKMFLSRRLVMLMLIAFSIRVEHLFQNSVKYL